MTSEFWKNDPKDHYRIFKDKRGRTVVKVVTPSGVVALISTDIPVTSIQALKEQIKGRILLRERASAAEATDGDGGDPPASD